jgi:hypothetical protein
MPSNLGDLKANMPQTGDCELHPHRHRLGLRLGSMLCGELPCSTFRRRAGAFLSRGIGVSTGP